MYYVCPYNAFNCFICISGNVACSWSSRPPMGMVNSFKLSKFARLDNLRRLIDIAEGYIIMWSFIISAAEFQIALRTLLYL